MGQFFRPLLFWPTHLISLKIIFFKFLQRILLFYYSLKINVLAKSPSQSTLLPCCEQTSSSHSCLREFRPPDPACILDLRSLDAATRLSRCWYLSMFYVNDFIPLKAFCFSVCASCNPYSILLSFSRVLFISEEIYSWTMEQVCWKYKLLLFNF